MQEDFTAAEILDQLSPEEVEGLARYAATVVEIGAEDFATEPTLEKRNALVLVIHAAQALHDYLYQQGRKEEARLLFYRVNNTAVGEFMTQEEYFTQYPA